MGWVSMQEDILKKLEGRLQDLYETTNANDLSHQFESVLRELKKAIEKARNIDSSIEQLNLRDKCEQLTESDKQLLTEVSILERTLQDSQNREEAYIRDRKHLESQLYGASQASSKLRKQVADLETINRSLKGKVNQLEQQVRNLTKRQTKSVSSTGSRLAKPITTTFVDCPFCKHVVKQTSFATHKETCFQNPSGKAQRRR